jgi:hypothetical protein
VHVFLFFKQTLGSYSRQVAADDLAGWKAWKEITDVIYRYCRALDRMDRDMATAVWHPAGTADYPGMFSGTGAGFVAWVFEQHLALVSHSHQVTNVLVELDGDRAASESYVTAALVAAGSGGLVERVVRGRYLDRWSQRDGRWAVDHRRYVHDVGPTRLAVGPTSATDGRRDTLDPSYDFLTR